MVAKTYQNLEMISEPYAKGKRSYVKVKTKSGIVKEVRWYTDAEYAKMYNEEIESHIDYRKVLGFGDAGYITIYKGVDDSNAWIFSQDKACRYHKVWGWYTISTEDPIEVPGVETLRLYWKNVRTEDDKLTEASAKAGYEALVSSTSHSQHMGEVGDNLELVLLVKGTTALKGHYGDSVMNFMEDPQGNEYIWTTNHALTKNQIYTMTGKVKAHVIYNGIKQTILHYCRNVKEVS